MIRLRPDLFLLFDPLNQLDRQLFFLKRQKNIQKIIENKGNQQEIEFISKIIDYQKEIFFKILALIRTADYNHNCKTDIG